jgi:serine/threonine protein kinase
MIEAMPDVGGFTKARRLGTDGGAGAFSLMLTATSSRHGDRVALKVFNPESRGDIYRVESFLREAELLRDLADSRFLIEAVSPVIDVTEVLYAKTGVAMPVLFSFYAMQLAVGSVQGLIAQGPTDPLATIERFRQMCRCVQYLHRRDACHRDIKPENFLILRDGSTRVADLGTARRLSEPSLSARYTGPPGDRRYAPPEQFCGLLDEDPRVGVLGDFFALGAVLFELLTGQSLAGFIYDNAFLGDLMRHFAAVPATNRRGVLDGVIGAISDARPLPSLLSVGSIAPPSVRGRLDALYQELAAIDYRARNVDFASIFRQLDICRVILANERAYQTWLARKRARRQAARA